MEKLELQKIANEVRKDIVTALHSAKAGHPGGSLSAADVFTYLYFEEMNIDPKDPKKADRDRFVLSKGHTAPGYYSALAERGFFPKEDLKTLRHLGSYLQGHPDMKHIPGVDMSSGSLVDVLAVFNTLSFASERKLLSDLTFVQEKDMSYSQRLETVFAYMNRNFSRQISLRDVAETVNMSEVSFSRFIKKATGQNFIDTLAEIRLGHVSRMLIDTDMTIAEIAFCCGFNNMANFNRIFKRKKGMPPHRFRTLYINKKIYV